MISKKLESVQTECFRKVEVLKVLKNNIIKKKYLYSNTKVLKNDATFLHKIYIKINKHSIAMIAVILKNLTSYKKENYNILT